MNKRGLVFLALMMASFNADARIHAYLNAFSVEKGGKIELYVGSTSGGDRYTAQLRRVTTATTKNPWIDTYSGVTTRSQTLQGTEGTDRWRTPQTFDKPLKFKTNNLSVGVYEIRVELIGTSGADLVDHLQFIVRHDTPGAHSKLLVVANSPTNMAYDNYGGESSYSGGRQIAVHRPNNPPVDDSPSYNEHAQWYMHQDEQHLFSTLDALGIKYEAASAWDLESTLDPADYDIVMFGFHSEYWSMDMKNFLESILTAGGRVISLSGNTMWWQVRRDDPDVMEIHKGSYASDPIATTCTPPNTPYGCLGSPDDTKATRHWHDIAGEEERLIFGYGWEGGGYSNNGTTNCSGGGEECYLGTEGYGGYFVNQCGHALLEGIGLEDEPAHANTNNSEFDVSGWTGSSWTGGEPDYLIGHDTGGDAILGYEVDGCTVSLSGSPLKPSCDGTDGEAAVDIIAWGPAYHAGPWTESKAVMGEFSPVIGGKVFNGGSTRFIRSVTPRTSPGTPNHPETYKIFLNVIKDYANDVGEWAAGTGIGSAVTADYDGDGIVDTADNCIADDNGPTQGPNDQLDTDSDGTGDVCDIFPSGSRQCS